MAISGPRILETPSVRLSSPKRRQLEIRKLFAWATKCWLPHRGSDGCLLSGISFFQYKVNEFLARIYALSKLERCVPTVDIPWLYSLEASFIPEMGAHLASHLVAIRVLVHYLVKHVHGEKGHVVVLQAHLDDVVPQRKDVEEELKALLYSLDESMVRVKVEVQAKLERFFHAKLEREC